MQFIEPTGDGLLRGAPSSVRSGGLRKFQFSRFARHCFPSMLFFCKRYGAALIDFGNQSIAQSFGFFNGNRALLECFGVVVRDLLVNVCQHFFEFALNFYHHRLVHGIGSGQVGIAGALGNILALAAVALGAFNGRVQCSACGGCCL